jgi:hypothetical protein
MRTSGRFIALLFLAVPSASRAQAGVPLLRLGPQLFTSGDLELDRVIGAGLLPDGRIAIANAGTSNVIVVDRNGQVDKRFGQQGSGPGDFGGLDGLATFADTIVTWDGLLHRITLWRPAGTVIRSSSLPAPNGQGSVAILESIASPSSYTGTIRTYSRQPANGLYLNRASLFDVNGGTQADLGRHAWSYVYFYGEGHGTSTFATPFLGTTLVASAAGKTLILGLGEPSLVLLRQDGTRGEVSLPVKPVVGRERAKAYADSMIAAQKDPDPDWVRRFRTMFGADFPLPERQAIAQRAVTVGNTVWYEEFQRPRDSTVTWWIVDARAEKVVGRVALAASARILGGNDRAVLVRLTDSDGVQSVAVYGFPKP